MDDGQREDVVLLHRNDGKKNDQEGKKEDEDKEKMKKQENEAKERGRRI